MFDSIMTRQLIQMHVSSDHYHKKETFCRISGSKKTVIHVCSFYDEVHRQMYEEVYRQYVENSCILSDTFLIPYRIRPSKNRLYTFSEFVQIEEEVSFDDAFNLLRSANLLLNNVEFQALRLYAQERYLSKSYYSNENIIPVYADCHPGNICTHDSKLKFIDIDSIVMLERKHSFDAFAFEWLLMSPCKFEAQDWVSERALQLINSHILPHLSYDYANVDEFLSDFLHYAFGQFKKAVDEKQFISHRHLSTMSRVLMTLKAAKTA